MPTTYNANANTVSGAGGDALAFNGSYSTLSSTGGNQTGQGISNSINNYVVQPGDSLSQIASQFGTTWNAIYAANQSLIGGNPNLIQPGQNLVIPNGNTNTSLSGTMSGGAVSPQGNASYQSPTPTPSPSPAPSGGPTTTQYNLSGELQPFAYTPEQQGLLNQFDTYSNQIQGLASMVDQNYNAELSQINAQMSMQKAAQQKENDAYAAGLAKAGAASGMAMSTPEIMKGLVHSAISDGIQKLTSLTIQQNGLILDAQKANITEKMDILKQLQDLDVQKYTIARQMKEDFYTNIKNEEERVQMVVTDNLPALYTEIKNLPPDQQQAKLAAYAGQLGIPVSKLQSYYNTYNEQEQKPITDMRTQLMASAYDVPWSLSDLSLSPEAFQAKLMGSKVVQMNLASMALDNTYKQSEINKNNATINSLGAVGQLTSKQYPLYKGMVTQFAGTASTMSTVQALQTNPNDPGNQRAFLDSFIRMISGRSVTKGQTDLYVKQVGGVQNLNVLSDRLAKGTLLSPDIIASYMAIATKVAQDDAGGTLIQAKAYGFPDAWNEYLGYYGLGPSAPNGGVNYIPGTVITAQDGTQVTYNADGSITPYTSTTSSTDQPQSYWDKLFSAQNLPWYL